MTKARLHPTMLEFNGAMGDMVFKKRYGKTYVSIKSAGTKDGPTPAQAVHRERFGEAVSYGKTAMADDDLRQYYRQIAKERNVPVFSLTIADFLNAPFIKDVDLSMYTGQADDIIKIKASDDLGLVKVQVTISDDSNGLVLDSGEAVETAPASGLWLYTATAPVSERTTVNVKVVATDHPGGTAVDFQTKTI